MSEARGNNANRSLFQNGPPSRDNSHKLGVTISHWFLWQFLTLISLVAAKNGRSCWRSPTCRSASICRRPWSPTLMTTSSTSSPSGRFSFDSSAKTASKWRHFCDLNLTFVFQETVFPLQQLLGRSLQLRNGSGGKPDFPCTSNILQIPHHTPRWACISVTLPGKLFNVLKGWKCPSVKPQGRLPRKSLIFSRKYY